MLDTFVLPYLLIERVRVDFVLNEELKLAIELEHKFSAGRNCIAIKKIRRLFALTDKLITQHHGVLGAPESAGPLLVHLCTWCHSVHCKVKKSSRFDSVDYLIDGLHDIGPDLVEILELAHSFVQLRVIAMDAIVHDTIQIQIQVIYTIVGSYMNTYL